MKFKPRPTEYKGVRLRSKSEAILARCFDLAGIFWDYEPSNNTGHSWDFFTSGPWGGEPTDCFIEYKPCRPTATYVESLMAETASSKIERRVMWGSYWNPEGGDVFKQVSCYRGHFQEQDVWPITPKVIERAVTHRFDLWDVRKNVMMFPFGQIKLTGSDGGGFYYKGPRIDRLRRVVGFVKRQWDMPTSPIVEMHDHEGNLCVVLMSNIGCYLASVISDAWDYVGECGDWNVEFVTP